MTIILKLLIPFVFAVQPEVNFVKGNLDKSDWNSSKMKGRVAVIFYVDPDKKNLNNKTSEALKEKKYDLKKLQSYAIIDMKATWLPNIAISRSLKSKQKKYPRTEYVKDYNSYLAKAWDFKAKGNDVFVLDSEGDKVFEHFGKLDQEQINKLIETIDGLLE